MPLEGIDPAADTPDRIRRNWGRIIEGAATQYLKISASGGITNPAGGLSVLLRTNSGLSLTTGGLGMSTLTTKGDLLGYGTALARLPVGTNTYALIADSSQALGIKWGAISANSMTDGVWVFSIDGTNHALNDIHAFGLLNLKKSGVLVSQWSVNDSGLREVQLGVVNNSNPLLNALFSFNSDGSMFGEADTGASWAINQLASGIFQFSGAVKSVQGDDVDFGGGPIDGVKAKAVDSFTITVQPPIALSSDIIASVGTIAYPLLKIRDNLENDFVLINYNHTMSIGATASTGEALAVSAKDGSSPIQVWYDSASNQVGFMDTSHLIFTGGLGVGTPTGVTSILDFLNAVYGPSFYIPGSVQIGNTGGFDSTSVGGNGDCNFTIGAGPSQVSNLIDAQDSSGASVWYISPTLQTKWAGATLLATPEDGAMEYAGSILYFTYGANRRTITGEVAHAVITGQTAVGNIVTYANPAADATYQISVYGTITAVTLKTINFQVAYTDETGASRTQAFVPEGLTSGVLSTTGAYAFPPLQIRVKASTTITVKTTQVFAGTSITFNAGGLIEFKYAA